MHSKMIPFPSSCWNYWGFFSDISYEDLVEFLEVKFTNVWVPLYDWVPLEFLTLRFAHTKTLAICQLWLRWFCPSSGFWVGFCSWISAVGSCNSQFLLVCLSNFEGQLFAVWPHFFDGPKNCLFFSFFFQLFSCQDRTAGLETRGPLY